MLLKVSDSSDIVDGSDYEVPILADIRSNLSLGAQVDPFGYMREPEYDMDDYVDKICKYIACPLETSYNEFDFHTPKTAAGNRLIPMLDDVKEAFLEEKRYQEYNGLKCNVAIDDYIDFIFINRFGNVQYQGTLNQALRRIIRDCNDMQLAQNGRIQYCCQDLAATVCGILFARK